MAPGGTYYYRIRASNSGGSSASSNISSITIPVAPATPSNGAVTDLDTDSIDLSWTDKAGISADGYQVLRAVNHGSFLPYLNLPATSAAPATTYTWTDENLTPGTFYDYHIRAFNVSGYNDFVGVNATTLTLAPSTLTATAAAGATTLNWTAPAGAQTYNVYRGTAAGAEAAIPLATGISTTTFTDTTGVNGTTYYYVVTAVNSNLPPTPAESAPSNEVSATASQRPAAPTTLTTNVSPTITPPVVTLNWTASPNAVTYNVYRGTAAGGESLTPIATGITISTFTDQTVVAGNTYYYTVTAINPGAAPSPTESLASNESAVSVLPSLAASYAGALPTVMTAFKTFSVTLTNTGSQIWNAGGVNPVHLAWYFGSPTSTDALYTWTSEPGRTSLPTDVAPGASINLNVTVTAPASAGSYILRLRMVKENVKWFDQLGKTNITVNTLAASYASNPPVLVHAGQAVSYNVTVTNTGTATWNNTGANVYHLGVYFAGADDSVGAWTTEPLRFNLPANVAPGASVIVPVTITAPADGAYVLRNRMVQEGVSWFTQLQKFNVTVDSVPPTVTAVTPADLSNNNTAQTTITASFSKPMDPTTISGATVSLMNGSTPVAATVTYNATTNVVTLTPGTPLAVGTYTVSILGGSAGVKDLAGNGLAASRTWSFTTIRPTVTNVSPVDGTTGVTIASSVSGVFSVPMDPTTINSTTITLVPQGGGPAIPASVSYNPTNNSFTLTPTSSLPIGTFTVNVLSGASGVKDVGGNSLASTFSWNFTTAPNLAVIGVTPTNGATNNPSTTVVTVTFSKAMNPTFINGTTLTLMNGATSVPAAVTYNAAKNTATLTPTTPLPLGAYTVTVVGGNAGVRDTSGATNCPPATSLHSQPSRRRSSASPPPVALCMRPRRLTYPWLFRRPWIPPQSMQTRSCSGLERPVSPRPSAITRPPKPPRSPPRQRLPLAPTRSLSWAAYPARRTWGAIP